MVSKLQEFSSHDCFCFEIIITSPGSMNNTLSLKLSSAGLEESHQSAEYYGLKRWAPTKKTEGENTVVLLDAPQIWQQLELPNSASVWHSRFTAVHTLFQKHQQCVQVSRWCYIEIYICKQLQELARLSKANKTSY